MRSLLAALLFSAASLAAADRPNILWLTAEDHGPHLGCYGDKYAVTPNIDAFAARGMLFKKAWSNAPVCAPARTCLISGRWAPADGAEHMRSEVPLPSGHQMYPQLLRAAGYYCTNNSKEDYNLMKPEDVWNESSKNGHWKNRTDGQPFFAIFNHEQSHESKIRQRPHTLAHDMAKAPVPPYHPDTPEVRHDWAQYYDNLTTVDGLVAKRLDEIKEAGLVDDTIIFYYADHGAGMPRSKRWPMNSGLHVPLIVFFPEKWKHLAPKGYQAGAKSDELVSFIDMAPTLLSIAGVRPPDYLQGRAFAGQFAKPGPRHVFGFRGRMDERYDLVRSATDGRFVYVRHFMPHLPQGQFLSYMFQQATTRVWHDQFVAGKTSELQSRFWKEKPGEELYDLENDPWETNNLAASAEHQEKRAELSKGLQDWLVESRDLGFIPEAERLAVANGKSPKDVFADKSAYPIKEVIAAAMGATDRTASASTGGMRMLDSQLDHPNPSVRYWAVMGHMIQGKSSVVPRLDKLTAKLDDSSPSVRIVAAEALVAFGGDAAATEKSAKVLLAAANVEKGAYPVGLEALNALDRHLGKLSKWKNEILALPGKAPDAVPKRLKEYCNRLMAHIRGEDK